MIDESWFDSNSFECYKRQDRVERYEIATEAGTLVSLENPNPVPYGVGDYILTGVKNERWIVSPETFKNTKEDLGNGECRPVKIVKLAKLADHDGHVVVNWGSGPQNLYYTTANDYIVRHEANDYGVVKTDIFDATYVRVNRIVAN
jgi:hypothetical protein